jgi:hypothetical protein
MTCTAAPWSGNAPSKIPSVFVALVEFRPHADEKSPYKDSRDAMKDWKSASGHEPSGPLAQSVRSMR